MRTRGGLRAGRALVAVVALALGMAGAAGGGEPERFEYAQTHMGTSFRIVLYSDDPGAARRASDAAFARIAALDAALSDYNPESELMRLVARAGGPAVPVSADLFDVLRTCRDLHRRSGGAFDPTVAPVVRLWRRARREKKLPDPDTLAAARRRVGFDRVDLDEAGRSVRLEEGVKLDLGGIAKGYASREALATLADHGITRALIAGAGDVAVGDPPPGEEGWKVAVDPLGPGGPSSGPVLVLRQQAVSTSGDAEQFVEIAGTRYAHIVDPRTGLGVVDRAGVTVVTSDAATADSLATAAFVLGPEAGLALIEATDGAAAMVVRETPGGIVSSQSRRFRLLPRADPGP